jgi:hypothetical protein
MWWQNFFHGIAPPMARRRRPNKQVEADFIIQQLKVTAGAKLDVPGGNGRLPLSLLAWLPAGVNFASEFVAEAR